MSNIAGVTAISFSFSYYPLNHESIVTSRLPLTRADGQLAYFIPDPVLAMIIRDGGNCWMIEALNHSKIKEETFCPDLAILFD